MPRPYWGMETGKTCPSIPTPLLRAFDQKRATARSAFCGFPRKTAEKLFYFFSYAQRARATGGPGVGGGDKGNTRGCGTEGRKRERGLRGLSGQECPTDVGGASGPTDPTGPGAW